MGPPVPVGPSRGGDRMAPPGGHCAPENSLWVSRTFPLPIGLKCARATAPLSLRPSLSERPSTAVSHAPWRILTPAACGARLGSPRFFLQKGFGGSLSICASLGRHGENAPGLVPGSPGNRAQGVPFPSRTSAVAEKESARPLGNPTPCCAGAPAKGPRATRKVLRESLRGFFRFRRSNVPSTKGWLSVPRFRRLLLLPWA